MDKWVLIDTETDGLFAPIHIIDIAVQRFDGLEPDGEPLQLFINHGIPIPRQATMVHGYTSAFIARHGTKPSVAYQNLRDFINDRHVCAHNLGFDWNKVLIPEINRLGEHPFGQRGFCTHALSKRTLPEHPTHKLDFLRNHYSLNCSSAHSARGDVESTTDLLTRIVFPKLVAAGLNSIKHIAEFSTMSPILRCQCLIQGLDFKSEKQRHQAEKRSRGNSRKSTSAWRRW